MAQLTIAATNSVEKDPVTFVVVYTTSMGLVAWVWNVRIAIAAEDAPLKRQIATKMIVEDCMCTMANKGNILNHVCKYCIQVLRYPPSVIMKY